jgi:hypothetical protein
LQWNVRRCAWSKFKSVRVERKNLSRLSVN